MLSHASTQSKVQQIHRWSFRFIFSRNFILLLPDPAVCAAFEGVADTRDCRHHRPRRRRQACRSRVIVRQIGLGTIGRSIASRRCGTPLLPPSLSLLPLLSSILTTGVFRFVPHGPVLMPPLQQRAAWRRAGDVWLSTVGGRTMSLSQMLLFMSCVERFVDASLRLPAAGTGEEAAFLCVSTTNSSGFYRGFSLEEMHTILGC